MDWIVLDLAPTLREHVTPFGVVFILESILSSFEERDRRQRCDFSFDLEEVFPESCDRASQTGAREQNASMGIRKRD